MQSTLSISVAQGCMSVGVGVLKELENQSFVNQAKAKFEKKASKTTGIHFQLKTKAK